MTAVSTNIQRALDANALREPVFRSVIQSLQLPPGSRGLDAGCGIGLQALLLAVTVGPGGHITGIDLDSEALAFGNGQVSRTGASDRVTFSKGDVSRLPFAAGSFDWAWSADCIGYPAAELTPLLNELARVVRPGGRIILLAWSSQQLLPGYPFLEAQLNAACSAYLPYLTGVDPELNFLRAARWFKEAGLEEVQARTFVGDVRSPLRQDERAALLSLFEMLWVKPPPGSTLEAWEAYQRLCTPGSPEFILDREGYYAFFTYSLVSGKVPHPGRRRLPAGVRAHGHS